MKAIRKAYRRVQKAMRELEAIERVYGKADDGLEKTDCGA